MFHSASWIFPFQEQKSLTVFCFASNFHPSKLSPRIFVAASSCRSFSCRSHSRSRVPRKVACTLVAAPTTSCEERDLEGWWLSYFKRNRGEARVFLLKFHEPSRLSVCRKVKNWSTLVELSVFFLWTSFKKLAFTTVLPSLALFPWRYSIPYWELTYPTYPLFKAFWGWFSFSRLVGYGIVPSRKFFRFFQIWRHGKHRSRCDYSSFQARGSRQSGLPKNQDQK